VGEATGYRIQVDSDIRFPSPVVDELSEETDCTPVTDLSPGTYYWRVLGRNTCGEGAWSQIWSFTLEAVPAAPALASPADGSSTVDRTPAFAWLPAERATAYQIQVDVDEAFGAPVVEATVPDTTFTSELPLVPGAYCWRVRGANSCGDGAWSTTWHFQCQSCLYLPLVLRD
jgi:hypothetical protein